MSEVNFEQRVTDLLERMENTDSRIVETQNKIINLLEVMEASRSVGHTSVVEDQRRIADTQSKLSATMERMEQKRIDAFDTIFKHQADIVGEVRSVKEAVVDCPGKPNGDRMVVSGKMFWLLIFTVAGLQGAPSIVKSFFAPPDVQMLERAVAEDRELIKELRAAVVVLKTDNKKLDKLLADGQPADSAVPYSEPDKPVPK